MWFWPVQRCGGRGWETEASSPAGCLPLGFLWGLGWPWEERGRAPVSAAYRWPNPGRLNLAGYPRPSGEPTWALGRKAGWRGGRSVDLRRPWRASPRGLGGERMQSRTRVSAEGPKLSRNAQHALAVPSVAGPSEQAWGPGHGLQALRPGKGHGTVPGQVPLSRDGVRQRGPGPGFSGRTSPFGGELSLREGAFPL